MKRFFRNKTVLIAAAVVLTLASVLSFVQGTVSVETPLYSFKSDIAYSVDDIHNVFPESYWAGLEALKAKHPNWKFVALHTTLTFERCMAEEDAEMYPTRNLVYFDKKVYGLDYPITTSWYSTEVPGSFNWEGNRWNDFDTGFWYQASKEAVEYCMDPRNFLDETQIFQFMDGSVPFSDSASSKNVVQSLFSRVGSNHWLMSGEELGLYYETEEPNPAYVAYLEEQAAIQASIEESIAAEQSSGEEENPPTSESEDVSTSEMGSESESQTETEAPGIPPETIVVKHYLTYAEAIQRIADELGINAAMITSRILQEQGVGESPLISGTKVFTTKEGQTISGGYYNYFNMGASGNGEDVVINNGLREAYENGWNTRYKALYGGAVKYKEKYLGRGQTTFYLQKFNVILTPSPCNIFYGQYMQNLTAPQTECKMLKNSLESANVLDADYTFLIPLYGEMEASYPRPTKDGNPNYKLGGIYVNGTNLDGFDKDKFTYETSAFSDRASSSIQIISYAPTTVITGTTEHDGIVIPIVWNNSTFTESGMQMGSHSAEIYLEVGKTNIRVTSKAENGDAREYSFSVFREQPVEPTEPESESSGEETEPSTEETETPTGSETESTEAPGESSSEPETEPESESETEPALLYGDVNGDGLWNIKDITLIGAYILKDIQLTGNSLLRADVNGDGKVNIQDITIIGAYILKDIPSVPQR